jgi:two-component system, chemotaxis family, chemotaxis protein CheY
MEFSEEELVILQNAIVSLIEEANTRSSQLEEGAEDKPGAEKRLEILLSVKSKLFGADDADEKRPAAAGLQQNFNKCHMLVVDDNESIRKHMILLLKKHGFNRFDEAGNGYEAIEKLKSKSIPYDLVLCDMNMPIISGLDVLRMIREDGSCAKIPFIMVTSENNKEILLKAIKAGVSDFVAKPVDEDNLLKKISALLA